MQKNYNIYFPSEKIYLKMLHQQNWTQKYENQ